MTPTLGVNVQVCWSEHMMSSFALVGAGWVANWHHYKAVGGTFHSAIENR
jgi:hypothetical protein